MRLYLSTFRLLFPIIWSTHRWNHRWSTWDFLPGERYPWPRFFRRMLWCRAVICLLVIVHWDGELNAPFTCNWAVHCYVIWSLDCFTARFVAICVTFQGSSSWFWTDIRLEERTTCQGRQRNGLSIWSEYLMCTKDQFPLQIHQYKHERELGGAGGRQNSIMDCQQLVAKYSRKFRGGIFN